MTRRSALQKHVAVFLALLCLSPGAFAQTVLRGVTQVAPIVSVTPAGLGGISASPLQLSPNLNAAGTLTPALSATAEFSANPSFLALPSGSIGKLAIRIDGTARPVQGPRGVASASPVATVATAMEKKPGAMLSSVQQLATKSAAPDQGTNAPVKAAAEFFDGNDRDDGDAVGPTDGNGGSGPGGGNDDGNGSSNNNGGGNLGKLYPRVVMILDTIETAATADEKLVQHIESLLDRGVRVIFVTARPEKGDNSAESMLTQQLKVRSRNPLIVVSYNGARIVARSSRAEKPRGLVEDLPGFAPAAIEKFREINARVAQSLGVTKGVEEFGVPSVEDAYIYGASIPESVDAAAWSKAYNRALKTAGFRYKIEMAKTEGGRRYFYTQSTALRLNTSRLFNGLYSLAPELNPATGETGALKPGEILVLADPAKAPSFLRSLPSKGYFMHGVKDKAALTEALSAVLGHSALEKVTVNRYDLREYIEWQDRKTRYGSGFSRAWKGNPANRELGFYRGIIMKELMARLYHTMRKGQYHQASEDAAVEMLRAMWYSPAKNGIRVPPEVQMAMGTKDFAASKAWKALSRGYFETSKRWLRNYYHRNFREYPRGVSQDVVGRMIRLSRDGDSITVPFESPYTGRIYTVYVRPDRTELMEDSKGYILVGHVYRTGREPIESAFEDSVDKAMVARALLEGDAQKRDDGKWYVNDEPDPRVRIVFHYNTRELSDTMTTAEVDALTPEITALIEKRETDQEYMKWRAEQDARREKALKAAERASKRRKAQQKVARADQKAGK